LDPSNLSCLYNTNFREEVRFEEGTEIRIFIKNKNGEKLQKTIVINAQEILDKGQLFFNVKDLNLKDISFYTYRMFESCIWYRGKSRFLSPAKEKIKFDVQKADSKRKREDFCYHLELKNRGENIEIKNNIEDLKLVKVFDPLEFFVVDRLDPNILYETFEVSLDDLKYSVIIIPLKAELNKNHTILYNHKYISVLYEV
jgi:hypothetical protein